VSDGERGIDIAVLYFLQKRVGMAMDVRLIRLH
jgi:hypothetical protein